MPASMSQALTTKFAGDVPQVGVAAAAAGVVEERRVEQLVDVDEAQLQRGEVEVGVDVDLAEVGVDRGDGDVEHAAEARVGDEAELGGEGAEQGDLVHHPAARLLAGGPEAGCGGLVREGLGGALHGVADRAADALGEQRLVVDVGRRHAEAPALSAGHDVGAARAGVGDELGVLRRREQEVVVDVLLAAARERAVQDQIRRGAADLEVDEQRVGGKLAGEVPQQRVALVAPRRVPEAEVEELVAEQEHPVVRLEVAAGERVPPESPPGPDRRRRTPGRR